MGGAMGAWELDGTMVRAHATNKFMLKVDCIQMAIRILMFTSFFYILQKCNSPNLTRNLDPDPRHYLFYEFSNNVPDQRHNRFQVILPLNSSGYSRLRAASPSPSPSGTRAIQQSSHSTR